MATVRMAAAALMGLRCGCGRRLRMRCAGLRCSLGRPSGADIALMLGRSLHMRGLGRRSLNLRARLLLLRRLLTMLLVRPLLAAIEIGTAGAARAGVRAGTAIEPRPRLIGTMVIGTMVVVEIGTTGTGASVKSGMALIRAMAVIEARTAARSAIETMMVIARTGHRDMRPAITFTEERAVAIVAAPIIVQ